MEGPGGTRGCVLHFVRVLMSMMYGWMDGQTSPLHGRRTSNFQNMGESNIKHKKTPFVESYQKWMVVIQRLVIDRMHYFMDLIGM